MTTADSLLRAVPHSPSSGIRALARLGFAAIGVVYLLMGILALMAATDKSQKVQAGREQAVKHLQDLPAGNVLLGFIAVGLLGYIVWRFTQAIVDTEQKGSGLKGIGIRAWYVASGLFYSGLALYAGRLALHGRANSSGNTQQTLTAKVLAWPAGDWLILVAGVVTIGVGLFQIYRALAHKLKSDVDAQRLSAEQERLVYRTAQIGVAARGVVVALIGYFLVQAGQLSRAEAVGTTNDAFNMLAAMGPIALGTVAVGLIAFGIHSLVQARYPILHGI